ncbi:MAG: hypothetical protein Ct9H300mP19_14760 [Dehalococcoidia bacterium]|nr:MAG: hypothetical protein Ct9H300mP19_14760 [Dehalococcoidia bacterium]
MAALWELSNSMNTLMERVRIRSHKTGHGGGDYFIMRILP